MELKHRRLIQWSLSMGLWFTLYGIYVTTEPTEWEISHARELEYYLSADEVPTIRHIRAAQAQKLRETLSEAFPEFILGDGSYDGDLLSAYRMDK